MANFDYRRPEEFPEGVTDWRVLDALTGEAIEEKIFWADDELGRYRVYLERGGNFYLWGLDESVGRYDLLMGWHWETVAGEAGVEVAWEERHRAIRIEPIYGRGLESGD